MRGFNISAKPLKRDSSITENSKSTKESRSNVPASFDAFTAASNTSAFKFGIKPYLPPIDTKFSLPTVTIVIVLALPNISFGEACKAAGAPFPPSSAKVIAASLVFAIATCWALADVVPNRLDSATATPATYGLKVLNMIISLGVYRCVN